MDPRVRVGNADRERAVAALQQYVADGYLTLDEFEQRSAVAHRAKTHGDLAAVTEDLTPASDADQDRLAPLARGRRSWSPAAVAVAVLVAVAAAFGIIVVIMMVVMMVTGMGGMGDMGGMR